MVKSRGQFPCRNQLNVVLTPIQRERLEQIAETYKCSLSEVIRILISQEWHEIFDYIYRDGSGSNE